MDETRRERARRLMIGQAMRYAELAEAEGQSRASLALICFLQGISMAVANSNLAQELFLAVGNDDTGLTRILASEDQFMAAVAEELDEVSA